MRQKIHLNGQFRQLELRCETSGLKPGMLVERTATGCRAQATSVGFAEKLFAMEDALQGKTVDDAYLTAAQNVTLTGDANAVADPVSVGAFVSGAMILAKLKAGFAYTIGMQLFPYGDGTLRPTTGTPKQLIAVCERALDLTASSAVDTLVEVRIA